MELEIKSFDIEIKAEDISDTGKIIGYASTFGGKPDSYGDIMEEGCFSETIMKNGRNGNGIAMLWQHDAKNPIGIWESLQQTGKGLKVVGQLALNIQQAKDILELVKIGAVKGLSIGFDFPRDKFRKIEPDCVEYDEKTQIRKIKRVELWEISLVTFPANINANITQVKSIIENAQNERELENGLIKLGISISGSQYIISKCKNLAIERLTARQKEQELNELTELLTQLREFNGVLETKKAIIYKKYPLLDESTPWDAGKEVKKSDTNDLLQMCAWYDDKNPDVKASYKLPHHVNDGYKTCWNGVKSAMGVLMGAMGGVDIPTNDRKAVYNHLKRHYAEFGKEPPELT